MKFLRGKAIHIAAFAALFGFYLWQTDHYGSPVAVYTLLGIMIAAWLIAGLSKSEQ